MREVKPPSLEQRGYEPTEQPCQSCGGHLMRGPIPCPDGKPGCLVLHYGYTCPSCGKMWSEA